MTMFVAAWPGGSHPVTPLHTAQPASSPVYLAHAHQSPVSQVESRESGSYHTQRQRADLVRDLRLALCFRILIYPVLFHNIFNIFFPLVHSGVWNNEQ